MDSRRGGRRQGVTRPDDDAPASPPGDGGCVRLRLDLAYETALARPIKPREQESLEQFLALQREHYKANPGEATKLARVGIAPEPKGGDQTELAAWAQVCRVILNLHETITRY